MSISLWNLKNMNNWCSMYKSTFNIKRRYVSNASDRWNTYWNVTRRSWFFSTIYFEVLPLLSPQGTVFYIYHVFINCRITWKWLMINENWLMQGMRYIMNNTTFLWQISYKFSLVQIFKLNCTTRKEKCYINYWKQCERKIHRTEWNWRLNARNKVKLKSLF